MKKAVSLIIAVMMTFSCAICAFATTDGSDEVDAKELKAINLTKLPDKLEYGDYDIIMEGENLDTAIYTFEPELAGAVIEAEYTDGSKEGVSIDDCEAKVSDPIKVSDILSLDFENDEDYAEFLELVYRNYTVEVTYKTANTTYNVKLVQDYDVDLVSKTYEFVSYNNPSTTKYTMDDVYEFTDFDDDDNEVIYKCIDIEYENIKVLLRNKSTGEIEEFGEDDVYIDFTYDEAKDGSLKPGSHKAEGTVWVDDGYVDFDYDFVIDDGSGEDKDDDGTGSDYEIVSIKNPDKMYYNENDVKEEEIDGEKISYVNIDLKGMEVTVKHKVTGKQYVVNFDIDKYKDYQYPITDVKSEEEILTLFLCNSVVEGDDSDNNIIEFEFDLFYNYKGTNDKKVDPKPATKDTATPDNSSNSGAVQTGTPVPAIMLTILMLSAVAFMFFAYRKKEN